jgi:DNA polymerase/3'-5' exonuclease PolX
MPPDPRSEAARRSPDPISPVNVTAAEWLERLADDLELQEPSLVRRITAYKLAAAALRKSPLRMETLWSAGREGALTQIEHVTPAIAQLLGELITTKRIVLPPRDQSRRIHGR